MFKKKKGFPAPVLHSMKNKKYKIINENFPFNFQNESLNFSFGQAKQADKGNRFSFFFFFFFSVTNRYVSLSVYDNFPVTKKEQKIKIKLQEREIKIRRPHVPSSEKRDGKKKKNKIK